MWQKKLYIKQTFDDNYVDDSFLMEMEKNKNLKKVEYSTLVLQSCSISIHLSLVLIFIAVYIHLLFESLKALDSVIFTLLFTLFGYAVFDFYLKQIPNSARIRNLKSSIILIMLLLGLSPMLKTLTKDIASDSLWAFTSFMFLANIAFHDYSSTISITVRFPDSLSVNAAIFASVLMASRLNSNLQVFALMLLSVELFALFPIFRRYLCVIYPFFNSCKF